jgi:Fic family protein
MRGHYRSAVWIHDGSTYAPSRYRKSCRYDAFIPAAVIDFNDSLPADLVGVITEAEAAVRSLNARANPALRPLARLLLRTESIASSKVEGLQVDARTLARAETKADAGQPPGPVVREVLANIDAMELAVEEAAAMDRLEPAHLIEIHRALMRNAPNAQVAGRLRTTQNWIGGNDYNPCGADFVPPPPGEVDGLLDDLCTFADADHLSPLVQAAVAHAQFETVHPFDDGNGRTGRALIHILLRRRGLAPAYVPPISVVFSANRDRYIAGLTRFRNGDVGDWLESFATATAQAASLAEQYLRRVCDLQDLWRARLGQSITLRADAAAWAIIDELPAHPVITLPVAEAATGRSRSSTNAGLAHLADAGVLTPLSESKRNRSWEADGLLDLLAELDASG